ncbi:tetratricopeptide repeat protein 19 homolog, mitochondrial [Culicoides brevitarsis]|uniref:tetratricopeptide repeat protein 19 homolog, mitochondrial n=1 Tax=Culicoides brevitarsis TaxID=469753 RepID=UPI00307B2E1A
MFKSSTFCLLRNAFRAKSFPRVIVNRTNYKSNDQNQYKSQQKPPIFLFASFPLWEMLSGKKPEEDTPEDKLIVSIKRGVLAIQKGDYKAAEKILHVALKMAQDLQHHDAVTYIYDVMANLAMEAGDFKKSEKLFVEVMQRLFAEGHKEDSIKMLHLSAKMAHICHFTEQLDKATQGFEWTLEKIKEKMKTFTDDEDLRELYGLTKNWYAQVLMDKKLFKQARDHFEEAYKIYTEIHGDKTLEGILMLNNLSVAYSEMNDLASAIETLKKVIELGKEIPKLAEIGIFHANLGLLYLRQSLINEATAACQLGYRLGLKLKNEDATRQSEYCLDRIKEYNKSQK